MKVAYLLTFIAFLDTFALLPTIGPYAAALGAGGLGMGLAVGAYSITDLMFNVVGGVALDRIGRRRLALVGFALVGAAVLIYPLVGSVEALVGARLLHGIGGGMLIPAIYTLVGDLSESGSRGRAMGRVGAVIGTAAVVAPGLAGAARARFGFSAVFVTLAVVMLAGLVISFLTVGETLSTTARQEARDVSLRSLLGIRNLQIACVAIFGFSSGFGTLSSFLPSQLEEAGRSPALSGGLFTLLALVAAVLMLTRLSERVDVTGPRGPVMIGVPALAGALIIVGITENVTAVAVGMVLFGIGFGIVYPAASGATALAAATPGRGRAFGIFSICYSLGFVIGPPLAGYLNDQAGISPFFVAAAISVMTLLVVVLISDRPTDRVRRAPS